MFDYVTKFEKMIAEFYGSPYAVATDCCTHAIELCLRYEGYSNIIVPTRTYISIPLLSKKLNIKMQWSDSKWSDYYFLGNTNIIDAAVFWEKNSYKPGTYMCLSFQFKKHLNLGRGGMILLDDKDSYNILKKMTYDGRDLNQPWASQDINTMGYHYYMTPETAIMGIDKLPDAIKRLPKMWSYKDYPDLRKMSILND